MSANRIVKWLTFIAIGAILYVTFGKSPSQKAFEAQLLKQPLVNKFSENFEKYDNVQELFKYDFSRWHQMTLQENDLMVIRNPIKNCIISDVECIPEKENSISLDRKIRYRGKQALKLEASATETVLGKKSATGIRRHLFDFKEGDDFYFSGRFYVATDESEQTPTLRNLIFMGLRSAPSSWRYRKEPGRFLLFDNRSYIASDLLYWLPKPELYAQDILEEVEFPTNKWVRIRVRMKLSADDDGLIEVWQDNKKVLYYPGKTMPESRTVYSILELGILKHFDTENGQTIYLDDIQVQDKDFF